MKVSSGTAASAIHIPAKNAKRAIVFLYARLGTSIKYNALCFVATQAVFRYPESYFAIADQLFGRDGVTPYAIWDSPILLER